MGISPALSHLIGTILLLILAQSSTTTLGQENTGEKNELRHRIVSSDSVVYASWSSLKDFKASGSPAEDWIGQPEIQQMFKKLASAIKGFQENNPPTKDDQWANELLLKLPELLRDCPATIHTTGYDEAHPSWKVGSTVIAIELNRHEELAKKAIANFVEKLDAEKESLKTQKIGEFEMQSISSPDGELEAHFGIIEGNFVCSIGFQGIEQTLANLETPAPEQVTRNRAGAIVDRPFFEVYVASDEIFQTLNLDELPEGAFEAFKLEEIKNVSISMGLDQSGVVASFFVKCPENPTGVLSAFNGQRIKKSHLADMPKDSISSAAASLSLANLFQLIQSSAKLSQAEQPLADSIETIENLTGLKFSEEILDSFEGTFFGYQKITNASVLSLRVKDKEQFAQRLKKCMKSIRTEAEAVEGGALEEKQHKDYTIYSFTQPVYLGPSFSWCHADDQFYVGMDARTISGHLRRRGRERGRLIDEPRFAEAYDLGEAKGWGEPIALSYVDMSTLMQLGIPLGRTFFGGQKAEGFDFSFDDVPSVEVLTNGVEANVIAVFRTADGIQGIERSTVPGVSSVGLSGVVIGMLLPAVQQVRAAARRVTAMNNMRQLQLAVLNYESAHGRLPPAYSVDAAGKPLLSWRVHILPYLEEKALYDKFHLDEPWDSPHNIKLVTEMPESFQNPNISIESGMTTFLGAGGRDGVFEGSEGLKIGQVSDGTSNTISIVDVESGNAVDWTRPSDFDPSQTEDLIGAVSGNLTGDNVLVAMVDGSTHTFTNPDEQNLREMMHRSDGKGSLENE